jgi:uncharacterized protein YjbJ (UPF0337 family)
MGLESALIWDKWSCHYVRFRTDRRARCDYLDSCEAEREEGAAESAWAGGFPPRRLDALPKELRMNWDRIQGNWKQVVGKAKAQWGKLTDDDLDVVAGRREQLAGRIQERYGIAKDEVEKQISDWELKATDAWFLQEERREEKCS